MTHLPNDPDKPCIHATAERPICGVCLTPIPPTTERSERGAGGNGKIAADILDRNGKGNSDHTRLWMDITAALDEKDEKAKEDFEYWKTNYYTSNAELTAELENLRSQVRELEKERDLAREMLVTDQTHAPCGEYEKKLKAELSTSKERVAALEKERDAYREAFARSSYFGDLPFEESGEVRKRSCFRHADLMAQKLLNPTKEGSLETKS